MLHRTPSLMEESITMWRPQLLKQKMVAEGAKIIDVGGESTRPGYERISDEDEIARIVPVIRALAQEVKVIISVDTYKASVARAAIEAGAHIINDIWGAKAEPEIAQVLCRLTCSNHFNA